MVDSSIGGLVLNWSSLTVGLLARDQLLEFSSTCALNSNDLVLRGRSCNYLYRFLREFECLCQQLNQLLVGGACDWRRSNSHTQRPILFARNFAARRTRNNSNRESEAAAVFGTLNHSAGIVNRKSEIVNRSFEALFKD